MKSKMKFVFLVLMLVVMMADFIWCLNKRRMMMMTMMVKIEGSMAIKELPSNEKGGNINSLDTDVDPDINNHHRIPREDWDKGHHPPSQTSP